MLAQNFIKLSSTVNERTTQALTMLSVASADSSELHCV